jgi:hypothetical protein
LSTDTKWKPLNPAFANSYAYVFNNPYKYIDPSGNEPITVGTILLMGAIGAVVGGVTTAAHSYAMTGEVNWGQVAQNSAWGFVGGVVSAVAVTGILGAVATGGGVGTLGTASGGAGVVVAGGANLAARFGTTAERVTLLERTITAEGGLNTSATVARQLANQRSFIPTQSILDTIGSGARAADPQGVVGQFMYRSAASFNGAQGTLEVLLHEASGQIRHVLFRSGVAP